MSVDAVGIWPAVATYGIAALERLTGYRPITAVSSGEETVAAGKDVQDAAGVPETPDAL